MILKKYAEKRPLVFNSKHVNVVEQFFFKKRPMSANIAFDILTTLADKRPELFEKKRRKYAQVNVPCLEADLGVYTKTLSTESRR